MAWSSEAIRAGIFPSKALSEMTEQDWLEFRNSLDPNIMGFDGDEGYPMDEFELPEKPKSHLKVSNNSTISIKDNLTNINYTDGTSTSRIKYIVIHYTANNGDTAWGNTNYFKTTYRGASAHYFVDENEVWRCVSDKNVAWHCGGTLQGTGGHSFYKKCLNTNSIGIEMCSRKRSDGTYYFKEQTIINCVLLVKMLMSKYNIPADKVIRHYDVTGKICPAPLINETSWSEFKLRLIEKKPDHWAKKFLDTLLSKNIITDKVQWSEYDSYMTRALAVAVIDNVSGGIWPSENSDSKIHWAQPLVISLCGKKIITDYNQWVTTLDNKLTKALTLALICNMTGGVSDLYKNRIPDHWARNCLDTLCDRSIVEDPFSWVDFDSNITKGQFMALICKAFCK